MRTYRLTPRMQQNLGKSLEKYHELFSGGRCSGWELEELIFKAIQSDSMAQHHAYWREGGHDDKADIEVATGGSTHYLQIKSGKINTRNNLTISGYRLGRFDGNLHLITEYLNNTPSEIISVSYEKVDDDMGRKHIYQINYIDSFYLQGISADNWKKSGKTSRVQENRFGVKFSLRSSMSWQIWWTVPVRLLVQSRKFIIR